MRTLKTLFTAIAALAFSAAAISAPMEIQGVKIDDPILVNGTKLELNGAGVRYRAVFKVYVGSLHATRKVKSLEELLAAPGPKRLTMTFLREVESGAFGKLLTRGVEDNVPKDNMSKLVPGLIRMGEIFNATKSLLPGEVITLDWVPGTGLIVTSKGKVQGEPFKEPEFFNALMAIWFGNSPADWKLKDDMLGVARSGR